MTRRPATSGRRFTWFARQVNDQALTVSLIGLSAVALAFTLRLLGLRVDPQAGVFIVAYAIAVPSIADLLTRALPSYFGVIEEGERAASTLPLAATIWLFGTWLQRAGLAKTWRHEAFSSDGLGRVAVHLVGIAALAIAIWATRELYKRLQVALTCQGTSWGLVLERHAVLAVTACVTALVAATYLRLLQIW